MNNYAIGQDIKTVPAINNVSRVVTVVLCDGQKCIQYGAHIWNWGDFFEVNEVAKKVEAEKEEGWHYCPYCEHKCKLINDHFNHIEFFHDGKPLIVW